MRCRWFTLTVGIVAVALVIVDNTLGAQTEEIVSFKVAATAGGPVAFSPDAGLLAVGVWENVEIWRFNGVRAERKVTLKGKNWDDTVGRLEFSGNGRFLASMNGLHRQVRLWELVHDSFKEVVFPEHHQGPVESMAFSPDGQTLATAGDVTIRLWNLLTAKQVSVLKGHADYVHRVLFSPDGQKLVSSDFNDTRVWTVSQGEAKKLFVLPSDTPILFSFSRDSEKLLEIRRTLAEGEIVGASNATVKVWDLRSRRVTKEMLLSGGGKKLGAVAISPDTSKVVTTHAGGVMILWDILAGKQVRHWRLSAEVECIRFSDDGKYLAISTEDGTVRIWANVCRD